MKRNLFGSFFHDYCGKKLFQTDIELVVLHYKKNYTKNHKLEIQ